MQVGLEHEQVVNVGLALHIVEAKVVRAGNGKNPLPPGDLLHRNEDARSAAEARKRIARPRTPALKKLDGYPQRNQAGREDRNRTVSVFEKPAFLHERSRSGESLRTAGARTHRQSRGESEERFPQRYASCLLDPRTVPRSEKLLGTDSAGVPAGGEIVACPRRLRDGEPRDTARGCPGEGGEVPARDGSPGTRCSPTRSADRSS